MTRRTRRLTTSALAVTVASAVFAAAAWAAGNSVHATAPSNAKVGVPYSIHLKGHAKKREKLYMFVDYHACASTPAKEHTRANGDIWVVKGDFKEDSKGWRSPKKGKDHVCAYLVKNSAPTNPSSGVLAHDYVTYTVHQ